MTSHVELPCSLCTSGSASHVTDFHEDNFTRKELLGLVLHDVYTEEGMILETYCSCRLIERTVVPVAQTGRGQLGYPSRPPKAHAV